MLLQHKLGDKHSRPSCKKLKHALIMMLQIVRLINVCTVYVSVAIFMPPPMKTLKTSLLIALAMLAILTGCGPGTGGTGTGPSIGSNSPTTPIFAPITYSGAQSMPTAVFGGSNAERAASVFGPSVSALRNAVLSLDTQRIDLRKACQAFTYAGDWSIAPDGTVNLLGTYSSTRILPDGQVDVSTLVAHLVLTFASGNINSTNLSATVRDSGESVLMGPFELQQSNGTGSTITVCGSP